MYNVRVSEHQGSSIDYRLTTPAPGQLCLLGKYIQCIIYGVHHDMSIYPNEPKLRPK